MNLLRQSFIISKPVLIKTIITHPLCQSEAVQEHLLGSALARVVKLVKVTKARNAVLPEAKYSLCSGLPCPSDTNLLAKLSVMLPVM